MVRFEGRLVRIKLAASPVYSLACSLMWWLVGAMPTSMAEAPRFPDRILMHA